MGIFVSGDLRSHVYENASHQIQINNPPPEIPASLLEEVKGCREECSGTAGEIRLCEHECFKPYSEALDEIRLVWEEELKDAIDLEEAEADRDAAIRGRLATAKNSLHIPKEGLKWEEEYSKIVGTHKHSVAQAEAEEEEEGEEGDEERGRGG